MIDGKVAVAVVGCGGMGGGPNGQGGGQGMTPPGDANGSQMTPPDFSGNGGTPPEKPSDNGRGGQPGGAPANRESALGIKEGSVITVQDSAGKTLCTATALGSMSSVIFSSADIKEGETYTVLVDGTSVGTAEAKLGTTDSNSSNSTFKPGQGGQPNQNGSQATVGSFKDVPQNSWFASAVQYVTSNSLMNGTSTTAFSPSATMSRGMLMTVLARYAGESTEGGTVWYEKGMNWAKAKGVSDGTNMDKAITREQLATMLYRYAELTGEDVSKTASLEDFQDADKVSSYAVEALEWAAGNGIVTGKTGPLLGAASSALLNALKKLAGIDQELDLVSAAAIEPIQTLKTNYLGSKNPRLHTDEILIALSSSAAQNPTAAAALKQLSHLKGCDMHSTVILSSVDMDTVKKLGMYLTCEPAYEEADRMYHKK